MRGFNRTFATVVACWQGKLTPLDTWSLRRPIWDLNMFYWLRRILSGHCSNFFRTIHFEHPSVLSRSGLASFAYLLVMGWKGFHRTYATGAACQQRTLTPPDTWSCPTLGLACVLMSRPISPELVLSPDFWISNTPRYFSFALFGVLRRWSQREG